MAKCCINIVWRASITTPKFLNFCSEFSIAFQIQFRNSFEEESTLDYREIRR